MIVEDIGPVDAKIMLVAEAPGEHEEQTGKPFMGASGQLLKQMLQHSGIDYNSCYVTNVSPIRPPNNQFKYYYDDKSRKEPSDRLTNWCDVLRKKIEKIKPNVVIALGAEALRAITNRRGIEAWRGTVLSFRNIKIVATYHPAAVLRQYSFHPIVEMDLAKANRESPFTETKYDNCNILTKPSLRQTLDWLKYCYHYPRIGWDIETVGKHVRCIGVSRGPESCPEAIVIPFIKFPSSDMAMPSQKNIIKIGKMSGEMSSYWNTHDEMLVLDALSNILSDKKIQKVGHNSILFDAPLMKEEFQMGIGNHAMDTMHAFHLLYSELPMGLKFLVTIMTNYKNYWIGKETENDMSEWAYCGMDAIATLVISYKLETELHESKMADLYKHINNLALSLAKIQGRGIKIDDVARKEMLVVQKAKLKLVVDKINTTAGTDFNPASPKQVKELLYDKMKFPAAYKDRKVTTNEAALKKLLQRYPNESILRNIVSHRKISKLINTFLEMNLTKDNRMITSYNASGTKGARISSSKTLWKTGMNLQNIPVGKSKGVENIRNLFVPSSCILCQGTGWIVFPDSISRKIYPDYGDGDFKGTACRVCSGTGSKLFVKADLVQAESMVVGELLHKHGDSTLRDLHRKGGFDIHAWIAAQFLGKLEKDITGKEREAFGKIPNHSGNYRAGPQVMIDKAAKEEVPGIDFRMAKRLIVARHIAIPGLKKWWRIVDSQLRSTRTITTCFGRRRIFFGRMDEATFRDATSFEPQSTVGDVTNRILTKIEMNPNSKLTLLLQVHDEIDGECYEKDLDEVVKEIKEAALIPLFINDVPLIIPIEIEVGKNWRDVVPYKEYKNGRK